MSNFLDIIQDLVESYDELGSLSFAEELTNLLVENYQNNNLLFILENTHSNSQKNVDKSKILEKNVSKIIDDLDISEEYKQIIKENLLENISEQLELIINTKRKNPDEIEGESDLEQGENTDSEANYSMNNFLNQSNGWLGNNGTQHRFSNPDFSCDCPACCTSLSPDPQNIVTDGNSPTSAESSATVPINSLISSYKWGFSWGDRTISYSFYENDVFGGSYYGSETGVREVSDGIKTNVRSILNWLESVIDVDFVEVVETDTNTMGRMRFMISDAPSYAYAYYPSNDALQSLSGDVHFNGGYDHKSNTNGFQNLPGTHGYMSIAHEIGHAMGLRHSHDGGLDPSLDNNDNTLMGYNFLNGDVSSASTFMPLDVAALQSLYGVKANNNGDDTYFFSNRIDQFTVNGVNSVTSSKTIKQTLVDTAGVDTLDFSQLVGYSAGYRIDLNGEGAITKRDVYRNRNYTVDGVTYKSTSYGTFLAHNAVIENVVNSSSKDVIILNDAANIISGYSSARVTGQDIIYNGTAEDILQLDYSVGEVISSQNGDDRILSLGTNGSITLKNYYLDPNNQIVIRYLDSIDVSLSDAQIWEGDSGISNAMFTLSLSTASSQDLTFYYSTVDGTATGGVDYVAASNQSVTFLAGETEKQISIAVNGDMDFEGDETFFVQINNAPDMVTLLDSQGMGTILNNDTPPGLSIGDITVDENGAGTVMVSLSEAINSVVTVDYSTANGTAIAGQDFNPISGTLTFDAGVTSQAITINNLINDSIYEPTPETFLINLSNGVNADISDGQGTVTINDDDFAPTLSINDISEVEGNAKGKNSTTTFRFDVSLSAASNEIVTVNYSTMDGTANASSDYLSSNGTLTFDAGVTNQTIEVTVNRDATVEVDETFFVNLSGAVNATLGDSQGQATILNDDSKDGGGGGKGGKGGGGNTKPSGSLSADLGLVDIEDTNIDILTGTQGKDTFTLGNSEGAFYTEMGLTDFALITDFNPSKDIIELYGNDGFYRTESYGVGDVQGTAIFYNNEGQDDLIAVLNGVNSLDFASNAVTFV
ncbi:MAG: Calx-beta domain-containing protein [Crocosphaera sp.]|nr:Calx-beta domain-containing protein [Crocosphaera sp.]